MPCHYVQHYFPALATNLYPKHPWRSFNITVIVLESSQRNEKPLCNCPVFSVYSILLFSGTLLQHVLEIGSNKVSAACIIFSFFLFVSFTRQSLCLSECLTLSFLTLATFKMINYNSDWARIAQADTHLPPTCSSSLHSSPFLLPGASNPFMYSKSPLRPQRLFSVKGKYLRIVTSDTQLFL